MRHLLDRIWGVVVDAEDKDISAREERPILLSEFEIGFELTDRDENRTPPANYNAMRLDKLAGLIAFSSVCERREHCGLPG